MSFLHIYIRRVAPNIFRNHLQRDCLFIQPEHECIVMNIFNEGFNRNQDSQE